MKQEEEISTILGSLRRIEAPENFEGVVRTRIAETRPARALTRPALLLGLKFAFPLLLLLMLGAFLILSNDTPIDQAAVPQPDNSPVEIAEIDAPSVLDTGMAKNMNARREPTPGTRDQKSARIVDPQMSEDQALTPDNSTVFPKGVDPRNAVPTNRKPPGNGVIPPTSILSMIGIASSCSPRGCLAGEVRPDSIAERSGVRSGDLIEAIDDRAIGSASQLTGSVSVSSLRILRDGRRITLRLSAR